jgi:hypothetical protein
MLSMRETSVDKDFQIELRRSGRFRCVTRLGLRQYDSPRRTTWDCGLLLGIDFIEMARGRRVFPGMDGGN